MPSANAAGCILGFDYGSKRIGVARADMQSRQALPLTTLDATQNLWGQMSHIVRQHEPSLVVVGWPRGLDGQHTQQTHATEEFARELEARYGFKVVLQDEALSSEEAQRRIDPKLSIRKQREVIDAIAAQIILEGYLHEAK